MAAGYEDPAALNSTGATTLSGQLGEPKQRTLWVHGPRAVMGTTVVPSGLS